MLNVEGMGSGANEFGSDATAARTQLLTHLSMFPLALVLWHTESPPQVPHNRSEAPADFSPSIDQRLSAHEFVLHETLDQSTGFTV